MAGSRLPPGWSLAGLADLGEVNRGRSRHRPRYAEHLYGGPYPFIQTGDIKNSGGRITSYQQTYSEAGLAQSRMWPIGTMCITIAANIAETGILAFPACFPDSVVGFIRDDSKCDVRFVEYTFRYLRQQIQHEASGSVQDNINLETLDRLRFPLPPLPEQRAIARILGTLDDKIELNRRMSETLEAMARALFKSWFVAFDPVRAKAEGRDPGLPKRIADLFPSHFVESELGEIPEGWQVRWLGELLEFAYGRALKAEDRRDGTIPVYGSNGQVGWHDERLIAGHGIVVGRKGNPGVVTWAAGDFFVIDTAFYVVPKSSVFSLHFLFHALRTHDLASLSADSAVPGLNRNLAYMNMQVLPGRAVLEEFAKIAQPLSERVHCLEEESRTVASLRDALLPRLISGELRVRDAEKIVGRAA